MIDQVQRSQQWLQELLVLMGYPARVTPLDADAKIRDSVWLAIDESQLSPDQVQRLIGKDGHTIDALQYLVNTIVNLGIPAESQQPFTLELNGYRQQREAELRSLVEAVAEKVRSTGEMADLGALSSAERRQVHHLFSDYTDLETESRGAEPDRHLLVRLKAIASANEMPGDGQSS
jgi:spoIIIJ-associated protein